MRIGVDARFLIEERTGVETYLQEILARLIRMGGPEEYLLFRGGGLTPRLPEGRWRLVDARGSALSWGLSGRMGAEGVDLFYSPVTSFPLRGDMRRVVTIHDLSWRQVPESYSILDRMKTRRWVELALARADRIVTVSESTGDDLVADYPSAKGKVTVVRPGVEERFFAGTGEREEREVRNRYRLPGRYLMTLASFHPRKNLPGLVEGFDRFRARGGVRVSLLIAGRGGRDSRRLLRRVARSPFRDDILLSGYVPRPDLPALYAGADLFLLVSRSEGFGIPALEAMAAGTPVLVSDLKVFEEVCGDAALRANPEDPDSIAEGIARSLAGDPERTERIARGKARAAGFRWEDSARGLRDLFREVAGGAA